MDNLNKSPYLAKFQTEIDKAINFMRIHNFSHPSISQACEFLQISPDELYPKSYREFNDNNTISECQKIRYNHFENRRKAKIKVVASYIAEKDLLHEHSNHVETSSSHSSQLDIFQHTACPPTNQKSRHSKTNEPELPLYVPISLEEVAKRKFDMAKHDVFRKLQVKENQKFIRQKSEEKIKQVTLKEVAKAQKIEMDKKIHDELRMTKIMKIEEKRKGILMKRHQEYEKYEKEALSNNQSFSKLDTFSASAVLSRSQIASRERGLSPVRRSVIIESRYNDDAVDEQLKKYTDKMENSTRLATRFQVEKAASSYMRSLSVNKVSEYRKSLQLQEMERLDQKLQKLHKNIEESLKRKSEIIEKEANKKVKNKQFWEEKLFEEQKKLDEYYKARENYLEHKDQKRQKAAKEAKDARAKRSAMLTEKNHLRKRDQEENIEKVNQKFEQFKQKIFGKHKEAEEYLRKLKAVDSQIPQIKVEAEMIFKMERENSSRDKSNVKTAA
ncbi:unnamed protein product [Blepharisma stoltei]|uniref:Uncharacterized protein n=1 Tax=Blepharisma stoltei TaxID=1481888 RepID=A0AAU9JS11_9CILI|nr:unnamed protein product [Blepharisma stoltei]